MTKHKDITEELQADYEDLRLARGENYAVMVMLAAKEKARIEELRNFGVSQTVIDAAARDSALLLYIAMKEHFPNVGFLESSRLQKEIVADTNNLLRHALGMLNQE